MKSKQKRRRTRLRIVKTIGFIPEDLVEAVSPLVFSGIVLPYKDNTVLSVRVAIKLAAKWDDYRKVDWFKLIDCPPIW